MHKFKKYKRGQIILVNFSPSMGSELRGKHFAIVLTKKDSPNSGVLTVVPLSSKEKNYYLDVGNIISKQIFPLLNSYKNDFSNIFNSLTETALELNETEIKNLNKNINDFVDISKMYISKNKRSYAMVQNITTISKFRIEAIQNKYDPLKKLIIDDLILDMIDKKLIELFVSYRT